MKKKTIIITFIIIAVVIIGIYGLARGILFWYYECKPVNIKVINGTEESMIKTKTISELRIKLEEILDVDKIDKDKDKVENKIDFLCNYYKEHGSNSDNEYGKTRDVLGAIKTSNDIIIEKHHNDVINCDSVKIEYKPYERKYEYDEIEGFSYCYINNAGVLFNQDELQLLNNYKVVEGNEEKKYDFDIVFNKIYEKVEKSYINKETKKESDSYLFASSSGFSAKDKEYWINNKKEISNILKNEARYQVVFMDDDVARIYYSYNYKSKDENVSYVIRDSIDLKIKK